MSVKLTKHRTLKGKRTLSDSSYSSWQDISVPLTTFDGEMTSSSNPWPPSKAFRHFDVGSNWVQSSRDIDCEVLTADVYGGGYYRAISEVVCHPASVSSVMIDRVPRFSDKETMAYGATAIAQTEPTDAYYSAATALGELASDGLPAVLGSSMIRDKTLTAKNAGNEYLSYEFGWAPLVRDVIGLLSAVKNSESVMKSYLAGSEKITRARHAGPTENRTAIVEDVRHNVWPSLNSRIKSARAPVSYSAESKLWFSGAFMYYIPESYATSALTRHAVTARKVYGLEITPEVMWNIAPWSWAADWFGNVGDVMHNISALGRDGLVMKYGYVMNQTKEVRTASPVFSGYRGDTYALRCTIRDKTQTRFKASPYGFGVSWDGLSPKQLAIMAAIGINR